MAATKGMVVVPNAGPQMDAFYCEADELYFGGEVGGSKTFLAIILALNGHHRSLILRRINDDARSICNKMVEAVGHTNGLNRTFLEWQMPEGKYIEFGGCQLEDDKQRYKGRDHDLKFFDEAADFSESQVDFICLWLRSAKPGQRCRVVFASNPPTTAGGAWLTRRFAPWLDKTHPKFPTPPGQLRWYFRNEDDQEIEVDGPGPYPFKNARTGETEMVKAISRTFIRSRLDDNPDYLATGYKDRLNRAPEDLRNVYRGGDYSVGMRDQPNQVIPTAWIEAAQKRWTKDPPANVPMVSMGVDCSGGGKDPLIIAPRYDFWFAPLIEIPGKELPMERLGRFGAAQVLSHRRHKALVVLDMGGGYGQSMFENLKDNDIDVFSYKGAESTGARSKDRQLGFYNVRSHALWMFREALDPDQEQGSPIALPPDQTLMADLTAPTFETGPRGIKVEAKEDIVKRLGRSTDHGDAVVMSYYAGANSLRGLDVKPRNRPLQIVTKRDLRAGRYQRRH